jgi:L-2-hydroxycarboxylate dehydrogenase (NAD+)
MGGILTPFVTMAADAGMIGIMWTQTGPGVAPLGGYKPLLGNGPFAVAIPAANHDPIVIDMAFTQSSASGVLLSATQPGATIPPGLVLDEHGEPTTDPRDFSDEEHTAAGGMRVKGTLTPLGNSHKGYAMLLALGVLAAVLSDTDPPWDLVRGAGPAKQGGSVLIAIDPDALNPSRAHETVDQFIEAVTTAPRRAGVDAILYPGQESQRIKREAWRRGTVEVPVTHIAGLIELAEELNLSVPSSFIARH